MIDNCFIIGGVRIDRDTTFEELKETGKFIVYDDEEYPSVNSKFNETLSFHESNCLVEIWYRGKYIHDIRLDYWDPERFSGLNEPSEEFQWKEWSAFLELMRRHYGEPDILDERGFEYDFEGGGVASGLYKGGRDPYTGGYLKIIFDREWGDL